MENKIKENKTLNVVYCDNCGKEFKENEQKYNDNQYGDRGIYICSDCISEYMDEYLTGF